MTVYAFLEVVNLTTVWDEGQSAFSMEELIFVSVLFEEQMMPWSGQEFHRHGVAFADFHGWVAQFHVFDAFVCHKVSKSMSCFMSQNIHVTCGSVPVCKDKWNMVQRQTGAVTAHSLAFLGENVKQVMVKHQFDKFSGFRGHFGVHFASSFHQLIRSTVWQRVAVSKEVGVIVYFEVINTDAFCLILLDFVVDRNDILYDLTAEVCDVFRSIAVAAAQQECHFNIAWQTKFVCLLGTVFNQLVVDFVALCLMIVKEFSVSLHCSFSDFTVRALLIWA